MGLYETQALSLWKQFLEYLKKKKNNYILYGLYFCGVGLVIGLTNVQFVVLHG